FRQESSGKPCVICRHHHGLGEGSGGLPVNFRSASTGGGSKNSLNTAPLPSVSAATAALVNAEKSTHRVEVLAQGAGGVLSRLFRRLFLEYLLKAFDAGKLEFFSSLESLRDRCSFLDYLAPLREAEWVVYAKKPFAGPEQVLDYVGRYT